ncbi:MAG: hypothetical protein ACTSW1_18360, partial [Candidatus Hodarchaeales archaeon]
MRTKRFIQLFSILLMLGLLIPQGGSHIVTADLNDDMFEDFEGVVFPSWYATGLWHLEDNTTSLYPMAEIPSGTKYMWYGDNTTGNFNTSGANSGILESNSFNLTGFSDKIFLEFWSYADTESGDYFDRKQVYISTDNGNTWDHIANITVETGTPAWKHMVFDITPYNGSTDAKIRFSFDSVDPDVNEGRGWLIDDVAIVETPVDYYDLWIQQDFTAKIGETHEMVFYAQSYYNRDMNVNIEIEIVRPDNSIEILYNLTAEYIFALSSWNISHSYTFNIAGHYDVKFTLTDDLGTVWKTQCYWEIAEDEYINLWINQEYDAWVGETKQMDFFAYSNFNYSMYNVTIKIEINGPEYVLLYYNETVYLGAYTTWNFPTSFTFNKEGNYEVQFYLMDDNGDVWETWCYWEVKQMYEHFELWIEQENFAVVNHYGWMDFYIQSYFSHTMPSVSIKIEIMMPDGSSYVIYKNDSYYFENGSLWSYYGEYYFDQIGHYDVRLSLVDDIEAVWETWCWWEVFETSSEFLWLDIEQDYIATIGETRWMNFRVYSNFTAEFYNVTIDTSILTPSGSTHNLALFDNVTLAPLMWWENNLEYTFNELGHYDANLTVTLQTGKTWTYTCGWEIEEGMNDGLEFWIEQDMEIQVGNVGDMRFVIINHFPDPISLDIKIFIEKDGFIVFDKSFINEDLSSEEKWESFEDFLFNETGYYDVRMEIYDSYDNSRSWGPANCRWHVYAQENTLDISIQNPKEVLVNSSFDFDVIITNYYNFSRDVNLELEITGPNGSSDFYYTDSYIGLTPMQKWQLKFNYTPILTGNYKIKVHVWADADSFVEDSFFDVFVELDNTTTTT